MSHINFTEDRVAVIREKNAAHGIEDHLEHGFGAQAGADDIRHCLGSLDVTHLRFAPVLALGPRVHNEHLLLAGHRGSCQEWCWWW